MRKQSKRIVRPRRVNPAIYRLENAAGVQKANEWRVTLYGICQRIKDGTFDNACSSKISDFLGVCYQVCEMTGNRGFFDTCCEAKDAYISLMNRYRETGKYGMTGDELKAFAPAVDMLAEAMGELPETTIKLANKQHQMLLKALIASGVK